MTICNGLSADMDTDPRVLWHDGTGRAACGSMEPHRAHTFERIPAWRRRALQGDNAGARDLTGALRS